ncbi:MAG: hypothetical protein JWP77_2233 [Polaromonas sp.]|jgi:hypothetical protein|nr:hypothetical protein [Polaromonas sp.]
MVYEKHQYLPFSSDAQRLAANLEQAYSFWLSARQSLKQLPASMYWAERNGSQYLYVKQSGTDNGTSLGVRCPQTEQQFTTFADEKKQAVERAASADALIQTRSVLYRRMRMPTLPDKQAQILRQLDIEGLLGTDLMVVGTNAFSAYEWAANAIFPAGNEETQDFDLTWCRGTPASLTFAGTDPAKRSRKTLFSVLKSIDASYKINPRKPYQAQDADGYEVELLAAPSCHPLPRDEAFAPMQTLIEQEWLLLGSPLSAVVATERGRACPLTVPDPRFMGLHKLWLADKPERNPVKREKDRRQGDVLLDAVRHFMQASHPLNVDFVFSVPDDLRPTFDRWCAERQFIPTA